MRESRELSLLLKLLDLSANQSKIMRVQEEALAHLLIQRQTHFTLRLRDEEEVTLELMGQTVNTVIVVQQALV